MYSTKSIEQTEHIWGTSLKTGLSQEQAKQRLQKYGENRLKEKKDAGIIGMFLQQLNDPLIYILMAAIAISLFLKERGEAFIIALVVVLNATVGVIQEGKAKRAIDTLKKLTSPKALVRRDGREIEIPAGELVPGDVVYLEAGRVVPADIRLTEVINLKLEEAALTGESLPAEKNSETLAEGERGIGDKYNMAFMSTMVTYGRGVGIVTATGMETQIGKIADMIDGGGTEMTPLQKRLADLGKVLSMAAVIICLFLFLVAVWQHRDIGDMLLTAISLAVAAVPEGLPAVVTIVLALSVSRMVKVNTIVRRLPCVETLGAVNVVCSDKTGTLTQNRMTVKQCFAEGEKLKADALDREKHRHFLQACTLCNDAMIGENRLGDPTELALLDLSFGYGYEKEALQKKYPRVQENAFDSERKRMTTVHRTKEGQIAYCKGAADEMLSLCRTMWMNGREVTMTAGEKKKVKLAIEEMAEQALRVLAVAMKKKGNLTEEKDLIFLGLVGMIDPPREEAGAAVEKFKNAHVDTVMITGDHVDTAFAIAQQLGIAQCKSQCISGVEMETMTKEEFENRAESARVYARVSPEHKVRIVEVLQGKGKVVAMTGDGINDAPSLKAADVGIAMGKEGTDVARNAADLVLVDDNFATIEKAMREGRGIYENIRKTILFLLSSNFGEILTMLVAVLAGLPAPLKASHILWINLITDSLPALSLGVDKNDGDALMREMPRKSNENMFAGGGLSCMLSYGVIIGAISLLAFLTVPYEALLNAQIPVTLTNLEKMLGISEVLSRAQTHAFTVLGMSQLLHAIGMRDVNKSVFRMNWLENGYMLFAVAVGILLQVLVTEIPYFVILFKTTRLAVLEWGRLFVLAAVPLMVHEIFVLQDFLTKRVQERP